MTRRDLPGVVGAVPGMAAERPRFIKSITSSVFPNETPYAECFRQAKNAGFEAIELRMDKTGDVTLESTVEQMSRLRDVAESVRIEIASLWILTPRSPSLASPNPKVHNLAMRMVKKGI